MVKYTQIGLMYKGKMSLWPGASLWRIYYHRMWGHLRRIVTYKTKTTLRAGLAKVLVSPWLVTLLHICRVIPTPQSPISLETPRRYRRYLRAIADVSAWPHRAPTSPHDRIEHRYRRIKWPPRDRRRRCPKRRHLHIERRYRRIK